MISYDLIEANKDIIVPVYDTSFVVNRCIGFDIGYSTVRIEPDGVYLTNRLNKATIKIIKENNPIFSFRKTHFNIKTDAYILSMDYVTGQILRLQQDTNEPNR